MAADRSTLSCSSLLFLFVLLGIPGGARSATLEDSAKEFARKIAAAMPAEQAASCEVRNLSSLRPDEVSRIERALKQELQDRGTHLTETSGLGATVIVTLSENWKELVWTSEIRQGDSWRTLLLAVTRADENHAASNAMHLTVRSEKFWEGPEHILDAVETSNGGKSWLVLLLPTSLAIQDLQTGSVGRAEIVPTPSSVRDPQGRLETEQAGNTIWFDIGSQLCKVNLETRSAPECASEAELAAPTSRSFRTLTDLSPTATSLPGMGMELVIEPVCGGTNQFLATSARDYTQTDSLQVFELEQNGPTAMSGELDFPGPILALHTALDAPRAIVRNLTTGNYEAYRLVISCGQ